jgi:hypothetical protein
MLLIDAVRRDDISPDGVPIILHWSELAVGASFFIPCINTTKCKQQLRRITNRKNFQVEINVVIENGMLGVRLWRML